MFLDMKDLLVVFPRNLCLAFSSLLLVFVMACEEPIQQEKPYIAPNLQPPKVAPIENDYVKRSDELVQRIYRIYNTRLFYRWDRKVFGNIRAFPPRLELVPDYFVFFEGILKYYVRNPYYRIDERRDPKKGLIFLRNNLPISIGFMGKKVSNEDSGISSGGFATSNIRIVIAGVNDYDLSDRAWRIDQTNTFHHELAHILDRRHGRPRGYDDISSNSYVTGNGWTSLPLGYARFLGFYRPYGASNVLEDFATVVEGVSVSSTAQVSRVLDGNQKLTEKYELVLDYYQRFGVDVQAMGEEFQILNPEQIEGEDEEKDDDVSVAEQ